MSGTCSTWRATHPEIPWENIVGMRHKVVHDYLGVDEDIVWQVVTDDLPKLVEVLEPLVPAFPDDPPRTTS